MTDRLRRHLTRGPDYQPVCGTRNAWPVTTRDVSEVSCARCLAVLERATAAVHA